MRTHHDHPRGPWRRHGHHHPREHFRGRPDFPGFDADFDPEDEMTPPFPPRPPFPPGPPFGGPPFAGGPFGRGRGRGRGRGPGRQRRGDVRAALLALLTERPMHGYEMIQEIAERSGGFWKPSPGSVYPTLQLLADEGLIQGVEGESGKRLFELTEDGTAAAARLDETPPWEQATAGVDRTDLTLRDAVMQLMAAAHTVGHAAGPAQKARAADILNNARRELYAILGEDAPVAEDDAE
ncbi:PadR family transcriptional regulator [Actinokineospora enzanensis]|uniref:PadR family transcriptional regulator n=1 Tax=Actinokineospora enzanensis TaxID=155975 RepID=UPI0003A90D1C|nr:PadR family transcriptional regulator [Actinokineospora enzanensis]